MQPLSTDWLLSEEEPLLARYLVGRVCGRASGLLDQECLRTTPSDKYFIGSLRPAPPPESRDSALPGRGFLDELLAKLAPVAIGAEFRLRPHENHVRVCLRLEWVCYYRVLPTLDEQREHQRQVSTAPESAPNPAATDDAAEPACVSEGESEETATEGESTTQESQPSAPSLRRSAPTDSLFPKYRKLVCSAEGDADLQRAASTNSWVCDAGSIDEAIQSELERVRDAILDDPDHLRVGGDPDARVRVPVEALSSPAAYAAFQAGLANPVLPAWRWRIEGQVRPSDMDGDVIFAFDVTNVSAIDPRAWHSEAYLFDVRASMSFERAEVLPFELELAPRSFRYDRELWGRGFNCAIERRASRSRSPVFETSSVPVHSQRRYTTRTDPPAAFSELASDPIPALHRILAAMRADDGRWEGQRRIYCQADPTWETRHGEEYERDRELFRHEIARFERGVHLVEQSDDVRLAFQLANRAFALSGRKHAWRLFQIVFLVSQLPGIHALQAGDQADMAERATVDIVYFPTGGGKTEAYLGVVVFHCFFDRLRGKSAGVTTWTRFPLRLLTLQQTQRVADVVGAAEIIRASHPDPRLSGTAVDSFAVGYFVGQEATPNELSPPRRGQPPDPQWSTASDPTARQRWKKIVRCPACGTSSITVDFDAGSSRLLHRCTNQGCRFPGGVLPVYVVDNEVYRFLPAVIVGTIDKLAGLGNQRKLGLVLGQVTGRCTQHGYYSARCCQKDCTDQSRLRPGAPPGLSGPTLFIQDELHLLKEGLGTFDAHYETFLQALLRSTGQTVPVKVIASSATIEAFDRQVLHLYGRTARVFPGFGPELGESFYAHTYDYPQRLFVGLLPHNKTIFNAVLELLQYLHEEIAQLARMPRSQSNPYGGRVEPGTPQWESLLNPFLTSLTYFSSTRELNSIRTDLEAHVNTELDHGGFSPLRIAELSGSTSTDAVTRILELLETVEPDQRTIAPNAILATSMISHGVDVDRLNCMVFYGMPKQNAEYIQASSRVGRSHIGIVFACLKPARERDQSHFSYFSKYHEFLGQLVEPVAINRWSRFSIHRTIPGLFMAVLLQRIANYSGRDNPNRYYMVDFVKKLISEGHLSAGDFLPLLTEAYLVTSPVGPGQASFEEEIGVRVRQFLDQILGAGGHATFVSDALIPPPMRSLRDVDEQVPIELDSNGSTWASRSGR